MNEEIENDEGWGNLIGPKKLKKIQEKYGIAPHSHLNGLMNCYICINACIFGDKNPLQPLIDAIETELLDASLWNPDGTRKY